MEKIHAKRPTIKDVAQLAGVSRTTVSLVLNNVSSANISPETRSRIHNAVVQLNYQPLEAARNLRTQASQTLGVAIPDAHNPHYMQIVSGIDTYAQSQGYSTSVFITNFSEERERLCFTWLQQKRSDALILLSGTGRALLGDVRSLHERGNLITNLSFRSDTMFDADIDSVVPQADLGEQLVLRHLAELGHQRIGYIYGVANHELLRDRLDACLRIQQQLGLPIHEEWIYRCGPTIDDGYRATQSLLQSLPETDDQRPTALVVVNDLLAMGVLAALAHSHIRVPQQMSVISFDNIPQASYTIPALTTVDYNARLIGEEAARLTIERLAQRDRPPILTEIPPRLIIRQSTAPICSDLASD
ncbi:LacI family DNA-binding transcriptional regulator [Dictyobacter aurantiacus]|uniref:LacI family transcriptional regulator n=1 Tax=Dictyobacter aurantiacus TaxID=1936993 RepID=A0A401ZL87_9CHLR|nr:LacI family DNA-binding transcriptional regulator [Dictyobacter aurantiacus]GCE07629.1 LacI family transcriptional regulator [Dictyobacter aurantiacus]